MKFLLNVTALLIAINSTTFCQNIQLYRTSELQKSLVLNGIDSTFKYIGPGIPLFIIDTNTTRQIALQCQFNNAKQNDFFLQSALYIKDSLLSLKLVKYLQHIRENIDLNNSYTWITSSKVYKSIVFQNDTTLISIILKEFEFWKNLGDSILQYTDSSQNATSNTNIKYYRAHYNYFKLGYVLFRLGAYKFNQETLINLGHPHFSLKDMNFTEPIILNNRPDTVILKRNYNNLSQIDFEYESQFNIFPFFGHIITDDKSYARLYHNLNHGILLIGKYEDQRESRYQLLEVILLEGRKLIVKHISGGIS